MSQPLIDLQHISKSFDGELVLDDLNLSIRENSFVTLLGPSGCGKTTTLRILGGFITQDTGKVMFEGQDITRIPPNKRQLNTVFHAPRVSAPRTSGGKDRIPRPILTTRLNTP